MKCKNAQQHNYPRHVSQRKRVITIKITTTRTLSDYYAIDILFLLPIKEERMAVIESAHQHNHLGPNMMRLIIMQLTSASTVH